jgi:hypothetical protein
MKKTLITGIAALLLATGAAHAGEENNGTVLGTWKCPGIGKIQYRKLAIGLGGFTTTKGEAIEDARLRMKSWNVMIFKGKRCKEIKDPIDPESYEERVKACHERGDSPCADDLK